METTWRYAKRTNEVVRHYRALAGFVKLGVQSHCLALEMHLSRSSPVLHLGMQVVDENGQLLICVTNQQEGKY